FITAAKRFVERRFSTIECVLLLVSIPASLTVGRTSFIGIAFFILIVLFSTLRRRNTATLHTNLGKFAALLTMAALAVVLFVPLDDVVDLLDPFVNFAFEFLVYYSSGLGLN